MKVVLGENGDCAGVTPGTGLMWKVVSRPIETGSVPEGLYTVFLPGRIVIDSGNSLYTG